MSCSDERRIVDMRTTNEAIIELIIAGMLTTAVRQFVFMLYILHLSNSFVYRVYRESVTSIFLLENLATPPQSNEEWESFLTGTV